jgi:hypothetical protein
MYLCLHFIWWISDFGMNFEDALRIICKKVTNLRPIFRNVDFGFRNADTFKHSEIRNPHSEIRNPHSTIN